VARHTEYTGAHCALSRFQQRSGMTEHPARNADTDSSTPPADEPEVGHAASDLSALVDEMEERVVAERQTQGHAGNAAERADTAPVEPDHQAPD